MQHCSRTVDYKEYDICYNIQCSLARLCGITGNLRSIDLSIILFLT